MAENETTDCEEPPAGDRRPDCRAQCWCGVVLAAALLLAGLTGVVYRPVMRDYHTLRELRHSASPVEPQVVRVQAAAFLQRNRYLPQAAAVGRWYDGADSTAVPGSARP